VLGALLMWPGVAGVAPLPAECVQAGPTGVVTCIYTTGTHALTLPEGVETVTVTAIGGQGGYGEGGNADAPSPSEWGGQAGTQTAGGAGGRSQNISGDGLPGRLGVGGTGGSVANSPVAQTILSGAGGGGGLYGGGGGSLGYSGGGGSSLLADGYHGASAEDPSITITYRPPGSPCSLSVCIVPGLFGSS
jgi:hypothetical protein